jgi:hypothetical protein
MLRPTVSRLVCLGVKPSWGPRPEFSYCWTVAVCWCVAPSLTRGRVCRLQLLLVLARAVILGFDSHRTHDYILLSQIRDSPNLEGQVPIFYILQGQGGSGISPDTGFPFLRLLRLAGLRWRYLNPPPHWLCLWLSCVLILQIQPLRGTTENTASQISSIVAWIPVAVETCRGPHAKHRLMRCYRSFP